MTSQSFKIFMNPNSSRRNIESSSFTNTSFLSSYNTHNLDDIYSKLESISKLESKQEDEPIKDDDHVVLFKDRKFKHNYSFIFSDQYFLDINENAILTKFIINKEGVFVYEKNFEKYCHYPIYLNSGNKCSIDSLTISFLPSFKSKFMICIFSVCISNLKVTQHAKLIVNCKSVDEIYSETIANVKNSELTTEGEHRFFIGIISKDKIKGILNISILNNINRIKVTRNHFKPFTYMMNR